MHPLNFNQNFRLKCGTVVSLVDLESAQISFVPCGQVDGEDQPILKFAHLWGHRRRVTRQTYGKNWNPYKLRGMNGVQLMTGFPTYKHGEGNLYLYYTSLDIEARMIENFPDEVAQIRKLYEDNLTGSACILSTKSEGLRLDAYTEYVGKKMSFKDANGKMLFEVLAEKCLARIDDRYAMVSGSVLEIPTLAKATLQEIYHIIAGIATHEQSDSKPREVVETSQIGDLDLEWDDKGRSQLFSTQHCQRTSHSSNRDEVRFTKYPDGSVDGKCFNCGESWWEIQPPKRNRPSLRASLTITGDAQETLGTLTDNDNALTEAFANALTDHELDTPHYHILHFEMGSGKNHSLLTSLATLKKRGIGIFENHEQVDEQVSKASLKGLSSAKLRGRGYRFDDSGLRNMDVHARRLFDEVFQRHPEVMCAFYDVIEKREEKGLAPYQYCLNCPFYKEKSCPYINQFIGVSENDFIATCMHDLFFDPNFRHILAGLWKTPEDSEEESLIGDALGVAPKEASTFDIGILDEVIARNLYLDYTYSFQDMHELMDAWHGEPLSDFMKQLLNILNDKKDPPLERLQKYIETLPEDVQMLIASQMTQLPEDVDVHEHTLRDKDTENVLSEAYIEEPSGIQRRIPVSKAAEVILREKAVPVRPYRKVAPKTKIGVSPYRRNGVSPDEVAGRLWAKGWTLLHQLQKAIYMDIEWIGTKYHIDGEQVCCDTFTITVPPQVSNIADRLILMGGTMDVENIKTAFEGQGVHFTTSAGIPARYARGVKTFQLTDRRLTYRSVFEVETDAEGKTVFDPDTKKPLVVGLTEAAENELEKLCMLAEKHIAQGNLKPVFISYKDFTETPISDIPIVKRMHQCLQVKHFDLTRGLNFEGVKVFIIYGLPKSARPDVVKETAEILYHTEIVENPLETTYQRGNEEREGYKVENIGAYTDTRMETVRQQLTRDKSKQALYRARPTRWEDTITLHFSAEPIPDWTERATGFVRTDLQTAEGFEAIGEIIEQRVSAEKNGDVKALADATGQSDRTAYRQTQEARQQSKAERNAEIQRRYADGDGETQQEIADALGIGLATINRVLKKGNSKIDILKE